jgi:rRNA maturation endonuclease Nob1
MAVGFWFQCAACKRKVIRHPNAQKCLGCGGKLKRARRATDDEWKAQFEKILAEHKRIPE